VNITKKPAKQQQQAQDDENNLDDFPGDLKDSAQYKNKRQSAQREDEQVIELPDKFQIEK